MEDVKSVFVNLVSKKMTVSLAGVLAIALNGPLGLGLDTNSIMAISSVVVGYLAAQTHLDSKSLALETNAKTVIAPVVSTVEPIVTALQTIQPTPPTVPVNPITISELLGGQVNA